MPVLDDETGELLGTIIGAVIHPDRGIIEGFFVRLPRLFPGQPLFLGTNDILHWGTRITVRHADVLGPIDDRIRVQELLAQNRPLLGQMIVTDSGRTLGRCVDVQFSTTDFRLEWLFPRRFFREGIAVPVSQIQEVKPEAIIVRETNEPVKEEKEEIQIIPPMPEAA
jgi:sporulation protein YlmC with PRC-barrel domain